MSNQVFQFKAGNNFDPAALKSITAGEIMNMTMPEFLAFQERLVRVRRRVRYDTAVYEKVNVTPQMVHTLFRKGLGQTEKYATSDNTYTKTRFNTNMTRNGEFEQGSLTIIYDISAPQAFTAGEATARAANGAIINPKATFSANNDPALNLKAVQEQFELVYKEGDSEDGIFRGLIKEFSQNNGQSGFLGSSVGGVAQNVLWETKPLDNPRVLEGGEDFSIDLRPLADLDLSAATGINQILVQKVELSVIELITVKL